MGAGRLPTERTDARPHRVTPYRGHVTTQPSPDAAAPAPPAATRQRGVAEGREFIALVTALMAMTALGIDLMLPAFPEIRSAFGMPSDSTRVSWIVTAYFLGMSVGPWLTGPASDRFGRRAPLMAGLALYGIASAAAALSPSWELIVVSRFVWGMAAAGPRAISTAMIRDRFDGDQMARLMSMIMAVFMLVPIIAPGLGAGLIAVLPWRVVFWFPAVIAVVMMFWSRRLPETLDAVHRRPFTWRAVGQAAREVVTHRQTMSMTIALTFVFGTMTTYLSGSEVIIEDVFGYGTWFALFFGAVAVLLAANSLLNARLVNLLGTEQLVRRLSLVGITTAAIFVGVSYTGGERPGFWLWAVSLCLVIPIAQGLSPSSNTLAMAPLPHVAGTASAVIATISSAGGALLGNVATSAFDGTVRPFAWHFLVYLSVAGAAIWFGTRRTPEL